LGQDLQDEQDGFAAQAAITEQCIFISQIKALLHPVNPVHPVQISAFLLHRSD